MAFTLSARRRSNELRRELLGVQKTLTPGSYYLPLSDEALWLAADLWAKARQEGRPTPDSNALDIDVILGRRRFRSGQRPQA